MIDKAEVVKCIKDALIAAMERGELKQTEDPDLRIRVDAEDPSIVRLEWLPRIIDAELQDSDATPNTCRSCAGSKFC